MKERKNEKTNSKQKSANFYSYFESHYIKLLFMVCNDMHPIIRYIGLIDLLVMISELYVGK